MARKTYPEPDEVRRVSIRQIAKETGLTTEKVERWLKRNSWCIGVRPEGSPPTYDARVIDIFNHLHGRPARQLTDPQADWLADYLRGGEADA